MSELTTTTGITGAGFEPCGARRFVRDEVQLDADGPWWTLRAPIRDGAGFGLWKSDPAANGRQVCDLPIHRLGLDDGDHAVADLLRWAFVTHRERVPVADADAPLPDLPVHELTAQNGPFTCQGRILTGASLTVDFLLAAPSDELSPRRRTWLDATVAFARAMRVVRIDVSSDGGIHARADLGGCPSDVRDELLAQTVACVRAAVADLLPALSLISDASVESRALELGAFAPFTLEKTT